VLKHWNHLVVVSEDEEVSAGKDGLLGGALQLVGALTDSQLQQTHRDAAKQDSSGLAVQLLADLKVEYGKRFKYTGKV
jgi:hypothetical protein